MTNEQIVGALAAFILANGATVFAIARWGVGRAIAYTHLVRDVKELQDFRKLTELRDAEIERDLKGLSMKIDRQTKDLHK
jgi:hypothetical protein